MLFKTDNVCQKEDAKNKCYKYRIPKHTEKVMKYKKSNKEKVNMLQRPSSLKQMNFKMECFSSLLVTINTVVIELKSNLKLTNLCRLDEWQLSATI